MSTHSEESGRSLSDIVGISSAVLCLIHCMVLPLVTTLSTSFFSSEAFCYAFLALGLFAVIKTARHTHLTQIKVGLWIGFTILTFAVLTEEIFTWSIVANVIGATILVMSHIANQIVCRNQKNQRSAYSSTLINNLVV